MSTVFILMRLEMDGDEIEGVFRTREAARDKRKALKREDSLSHYDIIEWPVEP